MESKLTPILRFREYEHEWKAKTFKELGSVAMCKRIFKEQTTAQGEIPFYKIGTFGKIADSYISRETYEEYKEKYIYPKVGDILLSASGTIGRTVIYDGEDAYFQDSNIIWFNAHKEPLDNSFLYQFYQVVKWSGLEGSTIKRLYNENVLSTNINLPSLEEQKKIGSFFKSLDETISLNQQELEALKQTKQGFLQKMFPKDGESVPEIRFPVFNDEWKLKKLKEIAEINPKSTLPSEFEYVDLGSVVGTRLLSSRKETKQTAPSRAQRVAKTGDVFYQTVRPYQQNNFLFDLTSDNFVFSTGYAQMRPNIDSYFLLNSLQVKSFVVAVMNSCTGTSYPAINSSDLSQLEIMVPVTGEEQIKIGEFFKQLDEVIELKEKELEALKETKKGFLQKMFV